MKKDLLSRLTSRKFWLTIAGGITFIANRQYDNALWLFLGYIGVEGAADVVKPRPFTIPNAENGESHNDIDGGLVTGSGKVLTDNEERPGVVTGS